VKDSPVEPSAAGESEQSRHKTNRKQCPGPTEIFGDQEMFKKNTTNNRKPDTILTCHFNRGAKLHYAQSIMQVLHGILCSGL
jgi:hypothetical protein